MAINFNNSNAGSQEVKLPSFMKTGKEANELIQKEQELAKMKAMQGNRFWLKTGSDTSITFIDGYIDADGLLTAPSWREHNIQIAGKYGNYFVCVRDLEPCPLCETDQSYIATGFTVIDHSEFTSKATGKTYKDTVKPFVCKPTTLKVLQKIAVKRGGLAGCTFDVSRVGDKAPAVGDIFDFTVKRPVAEVQEQYAKFEDGKKIIPEPINFGEVIVYRNAEELRALGFGAPVVGAEPAYGGVL